MIEFVFDAITLFCSSSSGNELVLSISNEVYRLFKARIQPTVHSSPDWAGEVYICKTFTCSNWNTVTLLLLFTAIKPDSVVCV